MLEAEHIGGNVDLISKASHVNIEIPWAGFQYIFQIFIPNILKQYKQIKLGGKSLYPYISNPVFFLMML